MAAQCNTVVFSNKAYNAIIRETFEHEPVETGGILLGHVVEDTWVVMEVLPPGIHSIFKLAYFEYDEDFVNYLAHSVANQYKMPLSLLGLWHRHPGSMDVFSGTDDETNRTYARQLPNGVISGLVNVDPRFRFTMYYLNKDKDSGVGRPHYQTVDVEVGDDLIPPDFFTLRYFDDSAKSDLHPSADASQEVKYRRNRAYVNPALQPDNTPEEMEEGLQSANNKAVFLEAGRRFLRLIKRYWQEILIVILMVVVALQVYFLFFKPTPAASETVISRQITPKVSSKTVIFVEEKKETVIKNNAVAENDSVTKQDTAKNSAQ